MIKEQSKQMKKLEISDVRINQEKDKAFIIVKKVFEDGNRYGLYIAE